MDSKYMMKYRKEIDGLRALAVMPVLFFHAGFNVFSGGYVGVDIFFVISGFLISSIILKEQATGSFSIINFYERRARRILPALFLIMLCCIPFAILWMWPDEIKRFFASILATSFFSSNILFYLQSGYFETGAELKPLLHTWSLAVEEQFYIVFPVFMILVWRFGFRFVGISILLITLGSLFLSEWASVTHPQANFYLPVTRAWELFVGVLCALYIYKKGVPKEGWISELAGVTGVILIFIAIFTFDKGTAFPGFSALLPVIGTGFILLFSHAKTYVAKVLSFPGFVGIGLISYSAYLWHHPLFAFARIKSLNEPGAIVYMFLIMLSLFLAYLSWRFVEQPFRKKEKVTRKQIFIFSLCGMFIFSSIGTLGYTTHIFNRSLNAFQQSIYEVKHNRIGFNTTDGRECSDNHQCIIGDTGKPLSIALIGDSHAGHLIHNLDELLIEKGLSAKTLTDADIYMEEFPNFYPKNERFNKAAKDRMKFIYSDEIDTIILSGRYTLRILRAEFDNQEGGIERLQTANDYHGYTAEQQEIVEQQIRKSILNLLEAGKQVILVYPIPEVGWNAPEQYLKLSNELPADKLEKDFSSLVTTSYDVYKKRHHQTIRLFDSIHHPNLKRIYPDKIFCNTIVEKRCVTAKDGKILYVDDDHLSIYGSRPIVDEIARYLAEKG